MEDKPRGLVFDIQRLCTHDGPGNRTTVFLKGCNLRCVWCHNPESQSGRPEMLYFKRKCAACGACAEVCPADAHIVDRKRCTACGRCAAVCPNEALVLKGSYYTAEELAEVCQRDVPFYGKTGGVTASGGEPMLQADFLAGFLRLLKARGVHTAVDTAGNVPFGSFEAVLPYADLFIYDVKAADSRLHEKITGVGNERIIENLNKLCALGARVWVRIPVIPGVNDGAAEQAAIDGLIPKTVEKVERLPYHRMAGSKYGALCRAEPNIENLRKL